MTTVVIFGARLIDGNGGAPLPDAEVRITDGLITSVGPARGPRPTDANAVDATGTTLIPGLINMHVHLSSPLEADRIAAHMNPNQSGWAGGGDREEATLLRAALRAQLSLRWGITTLRDAGGPGRLTQKIRDAITAGLLVGPRVMSSGRIITTSAGHGWPNGIRADNAQELRKAVRQLVEEGVDTIKIAATGGGTRHSNPAAAQYSAEELSIAVSEAHRLGKRVLAHCNGTPGIRNAVAAGVDTLEHLGWFGADGRLDIDREVIAQIGAKDLTVVPTLTVAYRPSQDDPTNLPLLHRQQREIRPERTREFAAMSKMGIRFATGTDTWDPLTRELDLMASEMGMTPLAAITAATRSSAEGLGLQREIGTIEPGKIADLVQVSGDPTVDLRALRSVLRVWRSGQLLVEGGQVLAADHALAP